jgi:hypothetical protein
VNVTLPLPLVVDLDGNPYPNGWQPSLGRVRDAATEEEALVEAIVLARAAPLLMGDDYTAALVSTLLTRLGRPIPGESS